MQDLARQGTAYGIISAYFNKTCKVLAAQWSYLEKVMAKKGYVYILMNKTRTVTYTGVTSDLKEKIWRHRVGKGANFTAKYNIKYLVYFEEQATMLEAIKRENQIKNWLRAWKIELIRSINPRLRDLWKDIR